MSYFYKKTYFFFTFIFILLGAYQSVNAQLFSAGMVSGANFSQIDGDDFAGYHKVGFNGGFIADIYVNYRWSVSMEILFSQKGSATGFNASQFLDDIKIVMDYVEVPVVVHFHDRNGMWFGVGAYYGRLLRNKFFASGVEIDNYFELNPARSSDAGFIADLAYQFNNPHFLANLRLSYSVLSFNDRISGNTGRVVGQYNNAASLRFIYLFNAVTE